MPLARRVLPHAAAFGAVAALTGLIALASLQVRIPNVSILYLPVVLLAAVRLGRGPAITASLAAFALFNFFLVEPRFTFVVGEAVEWLSLILLLLTAMVTGQLAADQRAKAEDAAAREREARVLYDVVQLMSGAEVDAALLGVAERLRGELDVPAVAIEVEKRGAAPHRVVAGDERALEAVRASAVERVLRSTGIEAGHWVRLLRPRRGTTGGDKALYVVPIESAGRKVGQLLLPGPSQRRTFGVQDTRLLTAVAAQLGVLVERARLRSEAAAAEVLRRTDELKSALLGAVSHELRTPLASILAGVTSLRQRDVTWSEGERDEFLGSIEDQARRLDRVVGNLLDLSRIEAGALQPQKGWYDAGALVDDVLGRLRHLTSGHPVRLSVDDDLPPVLLDYLEIDQVLSNLVENAAKYTPPESIIEIAVQDAAGEVRFAVRDYGPGIPRGHESLLFEPFKRFATGQRRDGVGLGLAVAKRLVEAHGGRLWLERPDGGGSRFVFTIPQKQPAS